MSGRVTDLDAALRARGVKQGYGSGFKVSLPLTRQLDHLPATSEVHLRIDVPDNRDGRFLHLMWKAETGKTPEQAHADLQRVFALFLNAVIPLP